MDDARNKPTRDDVVAAYRLLLGREPESEQIQTISRNTLAAHLDPIDLLHVDIQGSEVPVLRAAGSLLLDQVRRLVVGTHGRDVEGQMIDLLIPLGFQLRTVVAG